MTKYKNQLLPFHVIEAATKGDIESLGLILAHYDRYISKLSTRVMKDSNGNYYSYVDEEMKNRLRIRLIKRTLEFQIL